jgi:adenylate kinase family enzyme
MRRVSVVGNSGSGKSTVAATLAERLGVTPTELDAINHQAGWTPLPVDEFRRQVTAVVEGDTWVVDGNYSAVRDIVWSRADTVVWLDLPRWLVMKRVTTRTLRRVVRRRELWNGNRERWRNLFTRDKYESVILWSWTQHGKYHDRYAAAREDPANAHLHFVQLRSPREIADFLQPH